MMDQVQKDSLRRLIIFLAALTALAGLAWLIWPTFKHLREQRTVRQAQAFFAGGDFRNASLSARKVLISDPTNVLACRIMASLATMSRSPTALDWLRRIVEVEPTPQNKLQLATLGLEIQSPPFPLTAQILDEMASASSNLPAFQMLSADLAMKLNHPAAAEPHLVAAVSLEPTNQLFQLSLASVRLASTNQDLAEGARATLKQFLSDTNLSTAALRVLLSERIGRRDWLAAYAYSTQLLAGAGAGLGDRLQHLSILRQMHSAELTNQLQALQQMTATNANSASQVGAWMGANDMVGESVAWLTNLPPHVRGQSVVRLAIAAGFLTESNWPALRDFTVQGDWSDADFLRSAYLSRAWGQLGDSVIAQHAWKSAVDQAGRQLGSLTTLLKLAGLWELKEEQEDLLREIARIYPHQRWAWQELLHHYFATGETRKMNQLLSGLVPAFPKELALKNNLAATSLLLKTNLSQAASWAREDYLLKTNDPVVASTYAYALQLQGRTAEGVAVLEALDPALLEQPSTALYYGVLLAAQHKTGSAGHFLDVAQTDTNLLPEEKQLIEEARKAQ